MSFKKSRRLKFEKSDAPSGNSARSESSKTVSSRQVRQGCARLFLMRDRVSSVAHAAIGQLFGMDVIFGDEFFAERELIGGRPV